MSDLAKRLRGQAEQCELHGSPLTATLLSGAADDYEAGGPTADLLRPHADDPSGSVPSLRLAGALHRLVLERKAPELALHYPSVGGTPGDVWPVARRTIAQHLDELREGVRRPVQTNEVGRSAVLYGGLLQVGGRVRLLEVGASAGLNLLVDRFAYEVGGVALGDPSSPVRLREPWQGRVPTGAVEVVERAGCDPAPLDPASEADRLTLTSYVWGDQVERFERLRGALQIAAQHGIAVERLPASAFLERELAEPRAGVTTVVWHSVVRQYLDPDERDRVVRLLAAAGERATQDAPLAHLTLEPVPGEYRFLVELTTWPGGRTRVLAEAKGHGPPVEWL
ncbi:MAG: DUF2332 domain-containing protein [Actinobacteria bacterium]|nr:DUF2332 domain-containing protein [Actinomycetota bacterium]MCA1722183.1 DUF2332 domain-containing protein [Actinomycetota bacterium]